ncbi:EAL domain-containing protein [Cohnella pontilimi]|uniref:EAL domain-containing protein n=1 Tax=Cohnella pontilimi TaxID=2564100 RepID=A0A4U0FB73_9BACL|nr:EAL domain-containing protein [Cohnella pontilimi]TJY41937.1 EAL domain-containing protein [Cohnella pontilimi]
MWERKRVDPINIESLLDHDLIEQYYQPIIDLSTNDLYSHESLMRNKRHLNPAGVFRAAIENNRLYEIDALCISKSIRSYFALDGTRDGQTLFINIFPSSILNRLFVPFLENLMDQMQILPSCIVFELNETKEEEEIWETTALKQMVSMLRKKGFRIAMDDVGDGTANLRKIVEFVPDFIKMSRYFSTHLSTTERKQRILKLFVDYCGKETRMVLEGIENPDDLACARNLGIALGQGYLLGEPEALQIIR